MFITQALFHLLCKLKMAYKIQNEKSGQKSLAAAYPSAISVPAAARLQKSSSHE